MADVFDVVVIGTGPGGYVGAIRAAQLGLKTAVVEKDPTFGGTCLNVGCIPSKALLDSSEHFYLAQHEFADHGIDIKGIELNLPSMMKRKDKVVGDLTKGVKYLFDKNKITTFQGTGKIVAPGKIEVKGASTQTIECKNIVIATGSVPVELPFLKFDGKKVISSTEALTLPKVPKHLVVIGGGAIGLELGSVWMRLGAKVTVIEFADKIAGPADNQISNDLLKILKKQGMNFLLSTKVTGGKVKGDSVELQYENLKDNSTGTIEGDIALVSVGRKAYVNGLGLKEAGVQINERDQVMVDDHFQTSVPNIYAIGDVIRGAMLAHKAEEEGVAVMEVIAGNYGHVNYNTVPSIIYTWPELASVGKTEEELKKEGVAYKAGSFPFSVNGRAKAMNAMDGKVKILADAKTDKVLGVHIVGPRASDMIAEAVIAMEFSASAEDIALSFHAHPTLAEVMREAALAVDKRARQM